jgi:membrane-associated phospholipid phosphatase
MFASHFMSSAFSFKLWFARVLLLEYFGLFWERILGSALRHNLGRFLQQRYEAIFVAVTLAILMLGVLLISMLHGITVYKSLSPGEPTGGSWLPIVLNSSSAICLPEPPANGSLQCEQELQELHALQANRTIQTCETINYWNTGGSVRWNEIARSLVIKYNTTPPIASRVYALLSVAQYDSLVTTWNNKYRYNTPAPSELDQTIIPLVETSGDPCYPSEHAAVAAASAAILSYLYPNETAWLDQKATEHEESRLWAGVSFPSDITQGDALGRAVAEQVIDRAKSDGSDAVWNGTIPTGPGYWFSSQSPPSPPLLPSWGEVEPWLMNSSSEYLLPAPPAFGSAEFNASLVEVKQISDTRTEDQLRIANFWADGAGTCTPPGHWNQIACDLIVRYHLNELRAARTLALMNIAVMDAGICCWYNKYTYWLIRPSQADPTITMPVGLPNFPSYPSGHSSFSGAASTVLSYIFPNENGTLQAMSNEASMSRLYGGIHYRFDCNQALELGKSVGQLAIQRGLKDGSQ